MKRNLDITLTSKNKLKNKYDSILKLVPHSCFDDFEFNNYNNRNSVIFDLKGMWSGDNVLSL